MWFERAHPPVVRSPLSYSKGRSRSALRLTELPKSGIFSRCEKMKNDRTYTVNVLEQIQTYSTKEQIDEYINEYRNSALVSIAATKIQKFWRQVLFRKRFFCMVNVIRKSRIRRLRLYYSIWMLTLKPDALKAYKYFFNINKYYMDWGMISINMDDATHRVVASGMCFVSFDIYCKTNLIHISTKYNLEKIVAGHRSMMRNVLSYFFNDWLNYSRDKCFIRKINPRMEALLEKRTLFDPLFWTFHVLHRYMLLKRHPDRLPMEEIRFHVFEWKLLLASRNKKCRLNRKADQLRKKHVCHRTAVAFHMHAIKSKMENQTLEEVGKKFDLILMKKAYKALNIQKKLRKFEKDILKRLVYNWYVLIDRKIISRGILDICAERYKLIGIYKSMRAWKLFLNQSRMNFVTVSKRTRQHEIFMMRWMCALRGDLNTYSYYSALYCWREVIRRKRRTHSFVHFITRKGRELTAKKYILDIFRINAGQQSRFVDYTPINVNFRRNTRDSFIESKDFSFDIPTTSLYVAQYGFHNSKYSFMSVCDLSKEDVLHLFYNIVILSVNPPPHHPVIRQINSVDYIRATNDVNIKRTMLLLKDDMRERSDKIKWLIQKNKLVHAAHEAHEAAREFSNLNSGFIHAPLPKINVEKKEYVPKVFYSSINDGTASSLVDIEKQSFITQVDVLKEKVHPFFESSRELVNKFMLFQRKFRRDPNIVFRAQISKKKARERLLALESNNTNTVQMSTYDGFLNPSLSYQQAKKIKQTSFKLKELGFLEPLSLEVEKKFENSPLEKIFNLTKDNKIKRTMSQERISCFDKLNVEDTVYFRKEVDLNPYLKEIEKLSQFYTGLPLYTEEQCTLTYKFYNVMASLLNVSRDEVYFKTMQFIPTEESPKINIITSTEDYHVKKLSQSTSRLRILFTKEYRYPKYDITYKTHNIEEKIDVLDLILESRSKNKDLRDPGVSSYAPNDYNSNISFDSSINNCNSPLLNRSVMGNSDISTNDYTNDSINPITNVSNMSYDLPPIGESSDQPDVTEAELEFSFPEHMIVTPRTDVSSVSYKIDQGTPKSINSVPSEENKSVQSDGRVLVRPNLISKKVLSSSRKVPGSEQHSNSFMSDKRGGVRKSESQINKSLLIGISGTHDEIPRIIRRRSPTVGTSNKKTTRNIVKHIFTPPNIKLDKINPKDIVSGTLLSTRQVQTSSGRSAKLSKLTVSSKRTYDTISTRSKISSMSSCSKSSFKSHKSLKSSKKSSPFHHQVTELISDFDAALINLFKDLNILGRRDVPKFDRSFVEKRVAEYNSRLEGELSNMPISSKSKRSKDVTKDPRYINNEDIDLFIFAAQFYFDPSFIDIKID